MPYFYSQYKRPHGGNIIEHTMRYAIRFVTELGPLLARQRIFFVAISFCAEAEKYYGNHRNVRMNEKIYIKTKVNAGNLLIYIADRIDTCDHHHHIPYRFTCIRILKYSWLFLWILFSFFLSNLIST